jgi:hypothetical protein
MKNEIQNTASGGFMALHRLREPTDVRVISQLFAEDLPSGDLLSLAQAHQFNNFIRDRKAMNFQCSPKSLEVNLMTNIKHTSLRTCRQALNQRVGWRLPAKSSGITSTLKIRANARSRLNGFFPTFLLRDSQKEHKTFLETLLETEWHSADYAQLEHAVCNNDNNEVSVMAPFWAELFDVAANVAGEDSVNNPPIACDMKHSGEERTLMLYSTLCDVVDECEEECESESNPKPRPQPKPSSVDVAERDVASMGVRS